jgi:hypothetical protein
MEEKTLRDRARRREQRAQEREAAALARQQEAAEAAAATTDPELREVRLAEARVHARAARVQHNTGLVQGSHRRAHTP